MTAVQTSSSHKSQETAGRILETALQLFREKGFSQTSMREIAAQAQTAIGATYYHFDSKEALVMAFYQRAAADLAPLLQAALACSKTLGDGLRAVLDVKMNYFGEDRKFLGALNQHVADPHHPLSPFSAETKSIRDQDIAVFAQALSSASVAKDLKLYLPRMLWTYQMGIILFWIYDRSSGQKQTRALIDASLPLVTGLIRLASLPLARPLRKRVIAVIDIVVNQS